MTQPLIFELGCEDLPALQIGMAIDSLRREVETRCREARIALTGVRAYASPRRLTILVDDVAERQSDLETLKVGPAVSSARTPDGQLTPAALGFLKGLGADASQIEEVEQERKKRQIGDVYRRPGVRKRRRIAHPSRSNSRGFSGGHSLGQAHALVG